MCIYEEKEEKEMIFGQIMERTEMAESPLQRACRNGQLHTIKRLLKKTNLETAPTIGDTPLHWAAQSSHPNVIHYLLKRGARINQQDYTGATPLHHACLNERLEIVEVLLQQGANLNIVDFEKHQAPLHVACQTNSSEIVSLLLKSGANVHAISPKNKNTPLNYACLNGNIDIVRLLLEFGAAPRQEDRIVYNRTPLQDAIESGNLEIVSLLIDRGANLSYLLSTDSSGSAAGPLHLACQFNDEKAVSRFLQLGADVHLKSIPNGDTPLHSACKSRDYSDNTSVLQILINFGANVNAINEDGDTPCHLACFKSPNIVAVLLNHGANPIIKNKDGVTVFHRVCHYGYESIVSLLVAQGININVKNKLLETPLHYAVRAGHLGIVQILLNQVEKIKIDLKNKKGYTPLFLACMSGNHELVELLLAYGADVNVKNKDNIALFSWIIRKKLWTLADIFLRKGRNLKVDHLACYVKGVPPHLWKEMLYHRLKKPWLCFIKAVRDSPDDSLITTPLPPSHFILGVSDLCRYICEYL